MKLKKLQIIGTYKNFVNLEIDFSYCNGVSAFIGNNGSGKSNILEVFSSIFKSLYLDEKDEFAYTLEYETFNNVSVKITSDGKKRAFAVNSNPVFDIKDYLPKRVIAIYSGEEDRLWKKYYEPVYMNYIAGVNQSNVLEYPRMFYLNKFYWNLILLSLLISDAEDVKDFIKNKLGIDVVNEINFKFFKEKYKDYNNSPALSFIKRIDDVNEYSLKTFKAKLGGEFSSDDYDSEDYYSGFSSTDVFQALYIAFTPADKKIIDDIEIVFNNGVNVSSLSEGQKKMLLIKATLEFASSEDTLILLDEPDAHIHINNKDQILKVFEPYERNRQILITTHSPTLTQSFKDENVFMLTDGELIKKDKQFIINELTKDFWNKQQQNVFLATNQDLLLVEGKTDIKYIQIALEKLKSKYEEYKDLNFECIPFGGADGLENFTDKFTPKKGQTILALLDRDGGNTRAGKKAFMKLFNLQEIQPKNEPKYRVKNNLFVALLPKTEVHPNDNFMIEDYFGTQKIITESIKLLNLQNCKDFGGMTNIKSEIKEKLPFLCLDFEVADFEGFRKLFDLILEIKQTNNKKPKSNLVTKVENSLNKIDVKNIESTNEIVKVANKKNITNILNNDFSKKVNIKSESQHLKNKPIFVKKMYSLLKDEILRQDNNILLDSKIEYIAFKKLNKNIFDIKIQDKKIVLWVNKKKNEISEKFESLFIDCSKKGHHGNGDYERHFTNIAQVNFFIESNVIEKILKL
jgi:ABC-type cobalamin/Fe3+-siderophores transport system ATPase subunit/predicted transport protein